MTVELRLRPEAELELADAALWYEEQMPGWDANFLTRLLQPSPRLLKRH